MIIAGGAMRALEDVGLLGEYAVLFITPTIYFVVTGVTVLALAVGAVFRDHGLLSLPKTVGITGTIWATGAIGWAVLYGVTVPGPLRAWVPVATTGIALGVTGVYRWGAGLLGGERFLHPMYLFAVFGQMWDAAQNLVGVAFLGYSPKLAVTGFVYRLTGFSGSTFVLKLLVTLGIVWYLADAETEMNRTWWWLLTFFVGAIGLPMGVRGSLRMLLGV